MTEIQKFWESKRWPCRTGIYFSDGKVILLDVLMPWKTANKAVSVEISKIETIEEVKNGDTASIGWNTEKSYADSNLRVFAGEASHGSDGFIAVAENTTGLLLWLAFFDCSNPFEEISLENGVVTAVSNLGHVWHFPLKQPEKLTVDVSNG